MDQVIHRLVEPMHAADLHLNIFDVKSKWFYQHFPIGKFDIVFYIFDRNCFEM